MSEYIDQYNQLKRRRSTVKGGITRICNWFETQKEIENNPKVFKLKYDRLLKFREDYESIQDEIEQIPEYETFDKENRDEIDQTVDCLLVLISDFIDKLNFNSTAPQNVSVSPPNASFKPIAALPEIKIKPFDGKLEDWLTFIQLFNVLVTDNALLTDVQKFIYLKSFLQNEPLKIIENLPAVHASFDIAIGLLTKRYENKLSVINNYFSSLLDIQNVVKPNATVLRNFVVSLRKTVEQIQSVKLSETELWELLLIYIFEKKLDYGTRKSFESERDLSALPTLLQFFEFLEKRAIVMENLASTESQKPSQTKVSMHTNSHNNDTPPSTFQFPCRFCKSTFHRIYSCDKFKHLSVSERHRFVKNQQLCFNCLNAGHSENACKSRSCTICQKRHHTLLHFSQPIIRTQDGNSSTSSHGGSSSRTASVNTNNNQSMQGHSLHIKTLSCSSVQSYILLATAKVTLFDSCNTPIQARVLLDSASQNSFITQNLVNKLGLNTFSQTLSISGISKGAIQTQQMINITIQSNVYKDKHFDATCAILQNITCQLPQISIDYTQLRIPDGCELGDPLFYTPSDIDILIGADLYYNLLLPEICNLGNKLPVLQHTYLGWVIAGNCPIRSKDIHNSTNSHLCINDTREMVALFSQTSVDNSLQKNLEKFWQLEEISETIPLHESEEQAENDFLQNTKILPSGRFEVSLPFKFKNTSELLGDSYFIARRRFENLENKFQRKPEYFHSYKQFIDEYVKLGHGKIIPITLFNEQGLNKYFLPHHAVFRDKSNTTKIRVVFDGSCKTTTKFSLNDILHKGYQVQPELYDILCRFRTFQYALTADIEKMYRQVRVNSEHSYLQNILWRDSPDNPLQCIELNTITYGTNCAPFLATRVLHQLGETNKDTYPLASASILNQCYVDDLLTGANDLVQLKGLQNQLVELLSKHKFTLHKWCTNSKILSAELSSPNLNKISLNFENVSTKVLGLQWQPGNDTLGISVPSSLGPMKLTKRTILSFIAQCFDPLGLLSPVIVLGKLIIQKLWLLKLDWDTEINDLELMKDWNNFSTTLSILSNLKISRLLCSFTNVKMVELHGFADASQKAFAACVYIRAIYNDDTIVVNLITSKSRIAPVKTISLPRLELCAMQLLAKLISKLVRIFKDQFTPDSIHLWSDSTIALAWINSHPSRWTVFVANRVSNIQHLTSDYQWHHVDSNLNPADLPSRGVSSDKLLTNSLWWHGPQFLHTSQTSFLQPAKLSLNKPLPDERKVTHINVNKSHPAYWENYFKNFSTYLRLLHVMAYLLRFIHNVRNPKTRIISTLTPAELKSASALIVHILQLNNFSLELIALKRHQPIGNKQLAQLNPFLDERGLIRVGGRLEHASIPFEQKHPLLLPSSNHVVSLMLKYEHIRLGHSGAQNTLANFRLRFWPLNALRETKKIIYKCMTCFRFKSQPLQQIMADVPKDRVTPARAFLITGVDYGGPFLIKSSKLRKAPSLKCYMALFVCFVTRAVHLELVTDLSAEGYILALKRFIARRGNPQKIYSDNATNFLGAGNQLNEICAFFKNQKNVTSISHFLANSEIQFKLIPPRSPHWGGLWESAIKSAKYHIKRLIGNASFTFEEFYTVLVQIEAILNSRPLSPLSSDPNDLQPLTPGHFLIGSSLLSFPERDTTSLNENRLTLWQRCTRIQQTFWKRWSTEYLNILQNRPKWTQTRPNLKLNDLVLVKEEDTPPLRWPLARVIELFQGKDGHVRAVRIKTQNGCFIRNITRLCPLPSNE